MSSQKASLTFWGSSHLTSRHYFPDEMKNAMRKNHSEDRFQKPTYRAQSGGKISQDFVNEILSDMRSQGQQKQPQVHVVVIGGNNLREAHRRMRNNPSQQANLVSQEIGNVLRLFEQICKASQELESVEILIGSLIPSPSTYRHTEETFIKVHRLLRRLIYRFQHVQFCNFTQMHFIQNEQIRQEVYERDGIHLNQQGVKFLTIFISHRLVQISRKTLGC